MAETKSLVTRMTTNTTGFKTGTDQVIEQLNKFNKALVDNQYKQKECNKVIADAQKELKNTRKENEEYKKRIEELNKVIQQSKERVNELKKAKEENGTLTKAQRKELTSLRTTITNATKEIKNKTEACIEQKKRIEELSGKVEEEKVKLSQLRTEQVGIRQVISETSRAVTDNNEKVTDNNEKWTVLKGTLANLASDTLKKLAAQIVSIGKDVIQTGEQFSASMSEVGAISGATAEELAELEAAARLYGATTKFSATEAADALKYMALAGWNSQQAIAGLPAVLDLAAASGMDLGRASDIVTDYITAFGLEVEDASRFVDIMSYAMSHSNTTTEMLGEAYKNCAATAKAMGFSVEETTAALMTMANAGVKGGEAGTTLNTLMTRLATNTKGCADELAKYGVQIYDEQGKMHSLSEIMSGLISAFENLNQQQQANLSKMIAGTNQYAGFQTLMQGMSDAAKAAGMSFEDYTAALEQCEGTSNDMAKTMSNNLTGDLKALQSALDELKLKIYDDAETPLRNLVKLAKNEGIAALDGIVKNLKAVIPVIIGAATAMSTLKLNLTIGRIVSELTHNTDALKNAFQGLTIATEGATVAQEELNIAQSANVIGLVVTAVMSLISAFGTLAVMTGSNADETENANVKAKNYLETLQNLKQQEQERLEDVQNEGKVLKDLQDEYDNLRKQTSLSADEQAHLDTVANGLAKTLGISIQALKDKNGAYIDITGSVDEYIKKLEEQTKLENATTGLKEAYNAYDKAKKACQDYNKEIEKQQEIVEDSEKNYENLKKAVDDYAKENHANPYKYQTAEYNELSANAAKAKEEVERQKTALDNLKTTRAEYQIQLGNAMQSEIEYKKALGQTVDEEKEWEKCSNDMNSTAEKTNDILSKVNKSANELSETTEDVTKKTETLSEKYKRLNGLLEENEKAIKDVNDEIENAMDSGDTEHLEQLQSKLKELNSENTTLKNRIKAVKDEIEKAANAIVDAIDSMTKSAKLLATAEKEIADNGKFTLSTLNNIQKAYPELIDLTNQYIEGVKTEKDVIEGLKAAYENDKTAFSNAIVAKKLLSKNYSEDFVNNTINLFNEIRDKYDIDVTNFKNAADAKQAINEKLYDEMLKKRAEYDKLNADKNYMVLHNIDRGQADYKEFEYFKYDNVQNTWRAATSAEIDYYKKVQQDFLNSVDNYYDFQNQSTFDDVYNAYLSGRKSADNLKKNPVTLSGDGVTATGDTETKAYLTWIERMKALGKMSDSSEIYHLEQLKKRTDNTAEEIYQIDLKLYQARKKLAEDNAKNLADIEKKNQDALQERLNLAKAAYDRLVNGKIESLQKEAQAAKDTADAEIAALDAVMKKRNEEKEDQKRNAEINKINERLKYNRNQLTDMEITDLYRRRQELIDEQNEVNYQRSMELKKADIRANADSISFNVNSAISALQNNLSEFTNHTAALMGTQTAAQKVVNNNQQQNIQIVQNALSNDQLVQKLIRELQKSLYTG